MQILTLEDFETDNKTIFLRVDMNCPINPDTLEIIEYSRIKEACETIKALENSKLVVASHQGRVGRYDYIDMKQHAEILSKLLNRNVEFVEDVIGPEARRKIREMKNGDILLLDNLRFCAEENYEFPLTDASNTVMVKRLAHLFDLCVLDCFPSAHRAHPSIVGFASIIPSCAGKLVAREVGTLEKILTVSKSPFVVVLGGAKVSDRLEAIDTLVSSGRADKVLLTGLISIIFLKAMGRLEYTSLTDKEQTQIEKAKRLLVRYPNVFEVPLDYAVDNNGKRVEKDVDDLDIDEKALDIGKKTIEHYSKIINSSGTVFMSGPAGAFEREEYSYGTKALLETIASSVSTSIISGGHLNAALHRFNLADKIDHISTAGGALVLYLAGKKLPMIEVLEKAAVKYVKVHK
ncbi:MAG: phosphoglycerate kinase [Candidatus Nitrosothermus koennekii]|nr:MAG: phosphoglycerate kinase [Candidatus Nitrosothermus koennekii]